MAQIVANLNGGDNITPNDELIFKIYGDADNYATAIATTGNAINDADVSVTGGVVTILNVDVTGQANIKLTSIDAEGNESSQSVAFVAPAFEPEYQAVLDTWTTNGDTLPNDTQQQIENEFVKRAKTSGAWDRLDVFMNPFSRVGGNGKKLCWKRLIYVTPTGTPTENAEGVDFNGIDNYWDLLFNPSVGTNNFTLNSASFGIWNRTQLSSETEVPIGARNASAESRNFIFRDSGYSISQAQSTNTVFGASNSFLHVNRDANNSVNLFQSGTIKDASTNASDVLPNHNFFLGALNAEGTADFFSNSTISVAFIGSDMSDIYVQWYNAVNYLISATQAELMIGETVDLYLAGGQSNTAGKVPIGDVNTPAYLQDGIVDGVKVFDGLMIKNYNLADFGLEGNGNWVSTVTETNQWSFRDVAMKQLADVGLNKTHLVQITEGGTPISIAASTNGRGCWNTDYASIPADTPKLLQLLNERYDEYMTFANLIGINVNLIGMFWHQGEADVSDAVNYQTNLQNVINEIRIFTGNANLPIIYGTIPTASDAYNATIETAQNEVANADANLWCRDNSASTLLDAVHIDAVSSEAFGLWAKDIIINNY